MADILQLRGDTEQAWLDKNPLLASREPAFTVYPDGVVKLKVGTGKDLWKDLKYQEFGGGGTGAEGDMLKATYDPIFKSITGGATGTDLASISLDALNKKHDVVTFCFPLNTTWCFSSVVSKDTTISRLHVKCKDDKGEPQVPTGSLVITVFVNSVLKYTSTVLTLANSILTSQIAVKNGDELSVKLSGDGGLLGGLSVSLEAGVV